VSILQHRFGGIRRKQEYEVEQQLFAGHPAIIYKSANSYFSWW